MEQPACHRTPLMDYKILGKIGEGTYGIVYKARRIVPCSELGGEAEPAVVAVKKMRLDEHYNGVSVTTLREVALLKTMKHENVVRLHKILPDANQLFLVFEFLDIDLKVCMESYGKDGLPEELIKSCILQILRGVSYCHNILVMHRDLKPQNVLIDSSGIVKVADFGLARPYKSGEQFTSEVVTLWYRAPELLLGLQDYSPAVDLWSIGCIFAELALKQPLFPGDSEIDELYKIFRFLGTPNDVLWPGVEKLRDFHSWFPRWAGQDIHEIVPVNDQAADLLRQLLNEPGRRIKAEEALSHAYFDDIQDTAFLPKIAFKETSSSPTGTASDCINSTEETGARVERKRSSSARPAPCGDDERGHKTRKLNH